MTQLSRPGIHKIFSYEMFFCYSVNYNELHVLGVAIHSLLLLKSDCESFNVVTKMSHRVVVVFDF